MPDLPKLHKPLHPGKRHEPRRDPGRPARKSFYDSARWQQVRAAKLRRDVMCQCCLALPEGPKLVPAVHVDHWQSLASGGHQTDPLNLVSMCHSHHSTATMAERNGKPKPPFAPSKAWEPVFA